MARIGFSFWPFRVVSTGTRGSLGELTPITGEALKRFREDPFKGIDSLTVEHLKKLRGTLGFEDDELASFYNRVRTRVTESMVNPIEINAARKTAFQESWQWYLDEFFVFDVGLVRDFLNNMALTVNSNHRQRPFNFLVGHADTPNLINKCLESVLEETAGNGEITAFPGSVKSLPNPADSQLFPDDVPNLSRNLRPRSYAEKRSHPFRLGLGSLKRFTHFVYKSGVEKAKDNADGISNFLDFLTTTVPVPFFVKTPFEVTKKLLRTFSRAQVRDVTNNHLTAETRALARAEIARFRLGTLGALLLILTTSIIILLKTSSIKEVELVDQGLVQTALCFCVEFWLVKLTLRVPNRFVAYLARTCYFLALNGLSYSFFVLIYGLASFLGWFPG